MGLRVTPLLSPSRIAALMMLAAAGGACEPALPKLVLFPLPSVAPPTSDLCEADGFCGVLPTPGGMDLFGVAVVGTEVVAVGDGGTVLRYDGATWHRAPVATTAKLRDIAATGDGAWIVGEGGALLHLTPEGVRVVPSGTTADLLAVAAGSDHRAWAVGRGGAVLRLDGDTAELVLGPANKDLDAACIDPKTGELWVLADRGMLFRRRGETWSPQSATPGSKFDLLAATRAGVFLSSDEGLFRFEDGQWHRERTLAPRPGLSGLADSPSGDLWATTFGGDVLRRTGGEWITTYSASQLGHLNAVRPGAEGAWIVGSRGLVVRGDSRGTSEVAPDPAWWRAQWHVSVDHVYAEGGRVFAIGSNLGMLSWNGQEWFHDGSRHATTALAGHGSNDVWAFGEQVIHWNGRRWEERGEGLHDLPGGYWGAAVFGPNDAWAGGAVGRTPAKIAHWDGARWTVTLLEHASQISSMWGAAPNDLWAVGADATVLHWDGREWQQISTGETESYAGVWGTWKDAWIVASGWLLHWTGGHFEKVTLHDILGATHEEGDGMLTSVHGSGERDVWVTGLRRNNAFVLHWDGATWTEPDWHPAGEATTSFVDETGTLWVGTRNGALYQRRRR